MATVKLGEICEINPATDYDLDPEDACSYVPMEAVDDVDARIAKVTIRPFREVAKGYTPFKENDVIVAKITPCMENGKCAIGRRLRSDVAFGSTEFHVLRATQRVIPEWLFYFWRFSPTRKLAAANMTGSAGQKRVPASFLETADIPLPDLAQQRRIAGQLDQADRLRRTRRYALELTHAFLPATFLELFGDPEKNPLGWSESDLGELCEEVVDCPHSTPIYTVLQTPHPCVRSSDIQDGYLDFSEAKYVSPCEYHKRIARGKPMPGDVIYCREGARFGNAGRIIDKTEMCLGQRTMLFRANAKVALGEYIWAFLSSHGAYRQATRALDGSASPHVNVGEIVTFRVPVPQLSLQGKFASMCQRVDHLRSVQREALRQAEHLFASLLSCAFSG